MKKNPPIHQLKASVMAAVFRMSNRDVEAVAAFVEQLLGKPLLLPQVQEGVQSAPLGRGEPR